MYNTMRISGLASGIDTEEMIQNLMKVERLKVDRVEQDKQISLWRQEIYNDLNKQFANFILNTRKMFGLTSVTRTGNFRANAYQTLDWVRAARSSDETIATVSSAGKVMNGSYRVNVTQLAEGVSMASGGRIEEDTIDEEGKVLGSDGQPITELNFTINDGSHYFENGVKKYYDFEIAVENSNGVTMNDIVKAINSAKTADGKNAIKIHASYDAGIKRFFMQTTETGKDAEIKINIPQGVETGEGEEPIGGIEERFFNGLNLQVNHYVYSDEDKKPSLGDKKFELNTTYNGRDTLIDFNGATDIEYSSNRITINGLTIDLKKEGEFTINVDTDVDAVYKKIEEFVNEYNELVDKTNKLLGEKQNRDYRPLTADQKKAMEKEDIDLWEEKAKSGLLRNDTIIQRTMLNVRQSIYDNSQQFDGPFKLITEIGISTEEYSRGSAGGKLKIDEQKLKDAIARDPEAVMEFLFKESTPDEKNKDGSIKEKGQIGGIVSRIYDNIMAGMEDIVKKSGTGDNAELYRGAKPNILLDFVTEYSSISLLDKDVLQFNRRIDDLNALLIRKENSYYAKYAAMEKAISRMNQQSMWLMQQTMG